MYKLKIEFRATYFSNFLEQQTRKEISKGFETSNVRFVSLVEIFNNIIIKWPKERQSQRCIIDIDSGYFESEHFLLHNSELIIKFINNCNENLYLKLLSFF